MGRRARRAVRARSLLVRRAGGRRRGAEGDAAGGRRVGRGGGRARALGRRRRGAAAPARPRAARAPDRACGRGHLRAWTRRRRPRSPSRPALKLWRPARGAVPLDRRPRAEVARRTPSSIRSTPLARELYASARRARDDARARRLPPPQHPSARRAGRSRSTRSRCSASRSTTCRPSSGTRSRTGCAST